MTYDEFKILAKGMKAVYTQPTFLPDAAAFNIWYQLLQDIDYKIANAAIQKYMLTSKFPPTIADIREQAASVVSGEKPLWSDGWEEVVRAIKNYGSYGQKEAMESMSEITRMAVRRMGYIDLCRSENPVADRANFRMIFEQIAEREQKQNQLPVSLKNLIEEAKRKGIEHESERLSVPDKSH